MSDFNIGDIVALNSHPYTDSLTAVVITGEPQFIPPLMVVIEVLKEFKDLYDEKTSEEISKKGNAQCKCLWYSSKSHQFEEAWISSKLLKHVKYYYLDDSLESSLENSSIQNKNTNSLEISEENISEKNRKALYGRLVLLKTYRIEGGKKKSSISIESDPFNGSKDKNIINPLLSYVSPVMQIIQVLEAKATDKKEPEFDQKTGERKRFISKWLVKCKWYNPNDKLSEKLLPIECLELIPIVPYELLERVQEKIKEEGFYKYKKTVILPQKLYILNGFYFFKACDFILNKITDIEITSNTELMDAPSYYVFEAPVFDFENGEALPDDYFISQYVDFVGKGISTKAYLRIKYQSRTGKISNRTLKDYVLVNIEEGTKQVAYLRGYCMTRKAIRNFRIDRIEKMQVLII